MTNNIESIQIIEDRIRTHKIFTGGHHSELAIVIAHFNPCNYKAPVRNILLMLDNLINFNSTVYCGEVLCGARSLSESIFPLNNDRIFSFRSNTVWFHKEILWNKIANILPARHKKIVFLDADIIFHAKSKIFSIIENKLDNYNFVHPYSIAIYLDRHRMQTSRRFSSGWAYQNDPLNAHDPRKYHCGFGIATRRSFFSDCNGFFTSILGDGDTHLLGAITGNVDFVKPRLISISEKFWNHYIDWANGVKSWGNGSFSYVNCKIYHLYHGNIANRDYDGRLKRIRGFDPMTDTEINKSTGLLEWSEYTKKNKPEMVRLVADYFDKRKEDEPV